MNGGRVDGDGRQDGPVCELPWGPSRVAGGLLGVIGGEADGWGSEVELVGAVGPAGPGAPPLQGSVSDALVAVAYDYVGRAGAGVPIEAARRHEGATAPGWLLAVAAVRPGRADLVADTLELATAAGVPRRSLGACVAYVELAAGLLAALSAETAVQAAAGGMVSVDLLAVADPERATPPLCGESTADALSAGAWALLQDGGSAEAVAVVRRMSTPGVTAAVAGLLGLRDGCRALPSGWHRAMSRANACHALATGLVRSRCHGPVRGPGPSCRESEHVPARRDHIRILAGTAENRAEPVEPGGRTEAADAPGPAGWFPSRDRVARPAWLAGSHPGVVVGDHVDVGEGVSADAITEETEAIEERAPANAAVGVGEPSRTTADEWVGRSTPRRQLEGAVPR